MATNNTFDLNELPGEVIEGVDEMNFGSVGADTNENIEDEEQDSMVDPVAENEGEVQRRTFKSNGERILIYNALLERSIDGKLKPSTTREVSTLFSMHVKTVRRIWQRAKGTSNGTLVDVSHRRTKNCGRKRIEIDPNDISGIPLNLRTTMRSVAQSLNTSASTVCRRLREGVIRRHSNAIKPLLKEENKMARLRFCLSMLDASSLPDAPKFKHMSNIIHIDEKWFYMKKKSKTYYLLPEEQDPLRTCQSKNFIGKVMFLAAVARPRFDEDGNEVFSGKIGVFPLVTKQPAMRRSRNREAGTLETKPITSVTKEVIRTYLIEKVIPAIQDLWPREDLGQTIFIQQDNARTHIHPDDEAFRMAASQSGFDIRLMCQPPNSPDLNVLDLGFFSAIQSLQQQQRTRNVDELIFIVQKSFEEHTTMKLNHVFLTLQSCMKEIMCVEGSNQYKIPHMSKDMLERNGCLPKQVLCDYDLVEKTIDMLEGRNE